MGGGKSSSKASQQSGGNIANAGYNAGFSQGTSGGTSNAFTNSGMEAAQNVWSGQSPYLQSLYGQGNNFMQSQDPNFAMPFLNQGTANNQGITNNLGGAFNQSFGANNPQMQASQQALNPYISGLTNMINAPGTNFAEGGNNPLLAQHAANIMDQAGQSFARNIQPNIGRDAINAGQFGGSRQGIAEGIAAGDAMSNALNQVTGLYSNQYESDRAANLLSQQMNNNMRVSAGEQLGNLLGGGAANTAQGIEAGQGLSNLGYNPYAYGVDFQNQQWNPIMNQANVLGGPQVLSNMYGTTTGQSNTNNFANDIASQLGLSSTTGNMNSYGSSKSSGKGGGLKG